MVLTEATVAKVCHNHAFLVRVQCHTLISLKVRLFMRDHLAAVPFQELALEEMAVGSFGCQLQIL